MSRLSEVDDVVQAVGAEKIRAAEVRLLKLQMGRGGPESECVGGWVGEWVGEWVDWQADLLAQLADAAHPQHHLLDRYHLYCYGR